MPRKDQLRRLGPEFEPKYRATPVRSAAVVRGERGAQMKAEAESARRKAEAESAWETVQTKARKAAEANAAVAAAEQEAFRVTAKEAEAGRKAQAKAEEAHEVAKAAHTISRAYPPTHAIPGIAGSSEHEVEPGSGGGGAKAEGTVTGEEQEEPDDMTSTEAREKAGQYDGLGPHNCAALRYRPASCNELVVGDQICLQVPGRQDDPGAHKYAGAFVCLKQKPLLSRLKLIALRQQDILVPLRHTAVFEICSIAVAGKQLPKGTRAPVDGDIVHSQELLGLDFEVAHLCVAQDIDTRLGRPCVFGGDAPSKRSQIGWLQAVVFQKHDARTGGVCIGDTIQLFRSGLGYVTTSSGTVKEQKRNGALVEESPSSGANCTVNERQFVIESPLPIGDGPDLVDGGWTVHEGDYFRLRHIATDRYLGIQRKAITPQSGSDESGTATGNSDDSLPIGLCDKESMKETTFCFQIAQARGSANESGTRKTKALAIEHMSEVVLQVMCDPVLHACHLLGVFRQRLLEKAEKLDHEHLDEQYLQEFLKQLDEDKSGHVTRHEFHDALERFRNQCKESNVKTNNLSESDLTLLTQVVSSSGVIEVKLLEKLLRADDSQEETVRGALKHVKVECPATVRTGNATKPCKNVQFRHSLAPGVDLVGLTLSRHSHVGSSCIFEVEQPEFDTICDVNFPRSMAIYVQATRRMMQNLPESGDDPSAASRAEFRVHAENCARALKRLIEFLRQSPQVETESLVRHSAHIAKPDSRRCILMDQGTITTCVKLLQVLLKSPRAREYTKTNVVTNLSNDHEVLRLLWTLLTEVCREVEGNSPHALRILEICYGHDIFGKMGDLDEAKPLCDAYQAFAMLSAAFEHQDVVVHLGQDIDADPQVEGRVATSHLRQVLLNLMVRGIQGKLKTGEHINHRSDCQLVRPEEYGDEDDVLIPIYGHDASDTSSQSESASDPASELTKKRRAEMLQLLYSMCCWFDEKLYREDAYESSCEFVFTEVVKKGAVEFDIRDKAHKPWLLAQMKLLSLLAQFCRPALHAREVLKEKAPSVLLQAMFDRTHDDDASLRAAACTLLTNLYFSANTGNPRLGLTYFGLECGWRSLPAETNQSQPAPEPLDNFGSVLRMFNSTKMLTAEETAMLEGGQAAKSADMDEDEDTDEVDVKEDSDEREKVFEANIELATACIEGIHLLLSRCVRSGDDDLTKLLKKLSAEEKTLAAVLNREVSSEVYSDPCCRQYAIRNRLLRLIEYSVTKKLERLLRKYRGPTRLDSPVLKKFAITACRLLQETAHVRTSLQVVKFAESFRTRQGRESFTAKQVLKCLAGPMWCESIDTDRSSGTKRQTNQNPAQVDNISIFSTVSAFLLLKHTPTRQAAMQALDAQFQWRQSLLNALKASPYMSTRTREESMAETAIGELETAQGLASRLAKKVLQASGTLSDQDSQDLESLYPKLTKLSEGIIEFVEGIRRFDQCGTQEERTPEDDALLQRDVLRERIALHALVKLLDCVLAETTLEIESLDNMTMSAELKVASSEFFEAAFTSLCRLSPDRHAIEIMLRDSVPVLVRTARAFLQCKSSGPNVRAANRMSQRLVSPLVSQAIQMSKRVGLNAAQFFLTVLTQLQTATSDTLQMIDLTIHYVLLEICTSKDYTEEEGYTYTERASLLELIRQLLSLDTIPVQPLRQLVCQLLLTNPRAQDVQFFKPENDVIVHTGTMSKFCDQYRDCPGRMEYHVAVIKLFTECAAGFDELLLQQMHVVFPLGSIAGPHRIISPLGVSTKFPQKGSKELPVGMVNAWLDLVTVLYIKPMNRRSVFLQTFTPTERSGPWHQALDGLVATLHAVLSQPQVQLYIQGTKVVDDAVCESSETDTGGSAYCGNLREHLCCGRQYVRLSTDDQKTRSVVDTDKPQELPRTSSMTSRLTLLDKKQVSCEVSCERSATQHESRGKLSWRRVRVKFAAMEAFAAQSNYDIEIDRSHATVRFLVEFAQNGIMDAIDEQCQKEENTDCIELQRARSEALTEWVDKWKDGQECKGDGKEGETMLGKLLKLEKEDMLNEERSKEYEQAFCPSNATTVVEQMPMYVRIAEAAWGDDEMWFDHWSDKFGDQDDVADSHQKCVSAQVFRHCSNTDDTGHKRSGDLGLEEKPKALALQEWWSIDRPKKENEAKMYDRYHLGRAFVDALRPPDANKLGKMDYLAKSPKIILQYLQLQDFDPPKSSIETLLSALMGAIQRSTAMDRNGEPFLSDEDKDDNRSQDRYHYELPEGEWEERESNRVPSPTLLQDLLTANVAGVVTKYIDPQYELQIVSLAAGVGILLLSIDRSLGIAKQMQTEFLDVELIDCNDNSDGSISSSGFLTQCRDILQELCMVRRHERHADTDEDATQQSRGSTMTGSRYPVGWDCIEAHRLQAATRVLKLLQLFCEGHNAEWQDHLRHQDVQKNVNIVKLCCTLFEEVGRTIIRNMPAVSTLHDRDDVLDTTARLELFEQVTETIAEFCQGPNTKNQREFVHCTVRSGASVAGFVPTMLWWLAQHQREFLKAEQLSESKAVAEELDEKMLNLRELRLTMAGCEGTVVKMLLAVVEGGRPEIAEKLYMNISSVGTGQAIWPTLVGNGLDVLVGNMHMWAGMAMAAIAKREAAKNIFEIAIDVANAWERDGMLQLLKKAFVGLASESDDADDALLALPHRDPEDTRAQKQDKYLKLKLDTCHQYSSFLRVLKHNALHNNKECARTIKAWHRNSDREKHIGNLDGPSPSKKAVENSLKRAVISIEIVNKDDLLEIVHFPAPRTCLDYEAKSFIRKKREKIEQSLANTDVSNSRQRLMALLEQSSAFYKYHQQQRWFDRTKLLGFIPIGALQWTGNRMASWTILNTIWIHIIIMFSTNCRDSDPLLACPGLQSHPGINDGSGLSALADTTADDTKEDAAYPEMLWVLATIHMITSSLKCLVFYIESPIANYNLIRREYFERRHNQRSAAKAKNVLVITALPGQSIPYGACTATENQPTSTQCFRPRRTGRAGISPIEALINQKSGTVSGSIKYTYKFADPDLPPRDYVPLRADRNKKDQSKDWRVMQVLVDCTKARGAGSTTNVRNNLVDGLSSHFVLSGSKLGAGEKTKENHSPAANGKNGIANSEAAIPSFLMELDSHSLKVARDPKFATQPFAKTLLEVADIDDQSAPTDARDAKDPKDVKNRSLNEREFIFALQHKLRCNMLKGHDEERQRNRRCTMFREKEKVKTASKSTHQLKNIFQRLDTKQDGELEEEELVRLFPRPPFELTVQRIERWQANLESAGRQRWWEEIRQLHHLFSYEAPVSIYYTGYMVFSFLGYYSDPLFYFYHLAELFLIIPAGKDLMQTVGAKFKELIVTLFLGVVITYIYAVIGWMMVIRDRHFKYGFNDEPQWNLKTTRFVDWWLLHVEQGFRDGPNRMDGRGLETTYYGNGEPLYYLMISVSYFIVVVLVVGAVVSGIVIDGFGEKRDQQEKLREQEESTDFVSALTRDKFEEHGIGQKFDVMRNDLHSKWGYLYFRIHLLQKRKEDYTGQESYLYDHMVATNDDDELAQKTQRVKIFPIRKSTLLDEAQGKRRKQAAQDVDSGADNDSPSGGSGGSSGGHTRTRDDSQQDWSKGDTIGRDVAVKHVKLGLDELRAQLKQSDSSQKEVSEMIALQSERILAGLRKKEYLARGAQADRSVG